MEPAEAFTGGLMVRSAPEEFEKVRLLNVQLEAPDEEPKFWFAATFCSKVFVVSLRSSEPEPVTEPVAVIEPVVAAVLVVVPLKTMSLKSHAVLLPMVPVPARVNVPPVRLISPAPVTSPPLTVKLVVPDNVPAVTVKSPSIVFEASENDQPPEAPLKVTLFKFPVPLSIANPVPVAVNVVFCPADVNVPALVKSPPTDNALAAIFNTELASICKSPPAPAAVAVELVVTIPPGAYVLPVHTCNSSVLSEVNVPAFALNLISESLNPFQPARSALVSDVIEPSWRRTILEVTRLMPVKLPDADIFVTVTALYVALSSVAAVPP